MAYDPPFTRTQPQETFISAQEGAFRRPDTDFNFNLPSALNAVPALGANTMNGTALASVPEADTGGFLGSGYEFKSPVGDNKRMSAFLGFLKMIENAGTPSFKSPLADAAGAAAFGAEHFIATEAAAREAAMDERLLEVKETTAEAALLKAQTPTRGEFERVLAAQNLSPEEQAAMRSAWLKAKTTNATSTSQFERMIEGSDFTPERKAELIQQYIINTAASGASPTSNFFDTRQWAGQKADYYEKTSAGSQVGFDLLANIDDMRHALSKITTGAIRPVVHPLTALARDAGIDVSAVLEALNMSLNDVPTEEDTKRYASEMALRLGKEMMRGQGTVTEYERKEIKNLVAQLGGTPESNARALDELERFANTRIDKFTALTNWMLENQDKNDMVGFDAQWQEKLIAGRTARQEALASGTTGTINTAAPTAFTDAEIRTMINQFGAERVAEMFSGTP